MTANSSSNEVQSQTRAEEGEDGPKEGEDGPEEASIQTSAGFVQFFKVFFTVKGAPQILILSFLLAFGLGSTVGEVSWSQRRTTHSIILFSYLFYFESFSFLMCFRIDSRESTTVTLGPTTVATLTA